jgi:CRP-like cAMP-binding protein
MKERFPAFGAHLSPKGLEGLLPILGRKRLSTGETLLTHGQMSDTLYLIQQGKVTVKLVVDGAALDLAVVSAGHGIGETSVIEPGPASATVTAAEDCSLLTLSHQDFKRFGREHPDAAAAVLRALTDNIAARIRSSAEVVVKYDEQGRLVLERPATEEKHRLMKLLARLLGREERATEGE